MDSSCVLFTFRRRYDVITRRLLTQRTGEASASGYSRDELILLETTFCGRMHSGRTDGAIRLGEAAVRPAGRVNGRFIFTTSLD